MATYQPLSSLTQFYKPAPTLSGPINPASPTPSSYKDTISNVLGSVAKQPTEVKTTNTLSSSQTSAPYSGTSIVDYLNSTKQPSDYATRSKLATQYGINNYTGTAAQNTQLLGLLQKAGTSTPTNTGGTTNYSPASTGSQSNAVTTTPPPQMNTYPEVSPVSMDTTQPITSGPDTSRQGLLSNLTSVAQGIQPLIGKTAENITSLRNELAAKNQGLLTQGGDQQLQLGRAGVLQGIEAQKEQALQQQLQNQISGATAAGGLLGNAVGYQQPTQVSPGTALVTPSGQQVYSGLGGLVGLGIANQNIKQGQTYQSNAADLSQQLGILKTTGDNVTNLLNSSGLSLTNNPELNKVTIENWGKNVNPQAYTSYMAGVGELENSISGIIAGYTGQTPTAVTQTLEAMQFKYLSPTQLKGFLDNIDQLGQYRLQKYQEGATGSYGAATTGTPYTGTGATSGTLSAGSSINPLEATAGLGVQASGSLFNLIKNIFSKVTGAAETGAAASLFL